MDETNIVNAEYRVPTYEPDGDRGWFHFLYGNVPAHQIDFIYRPVVPREPLTRQHFTHLSRIVKYIEPRAGAEYSFAIANLSRDDTQFEPGHGGIAFVFGLRIHGARDHAGRQDPPFSHSAAAIDRHLDAQTLHQIAVQFYDKLLPEEKSQRGGGAWYRRYVANAGKSEALLPLLKGYLDEFAGLSVPEPSRLGLRWSAEHSSELRRVVVVYPDRADFSTLAHAMAQLAAVLIESDLKWTVISNGREHDVAGGLTVRFIPERDATAEADDVVVWSLDQLPQDPAEIAARLFGAYSAQRSHSPIFNMAAGANGMARALRAPADLERTQLSAMEGGVNGASAEGAPDLLSDVKKGPRKQTILTLLVMLLSLGVLGLLFLIWVVVQPEERPERMTEKNVVRSAEPKAIVAPVASGVSTPVVVATAEPSEAPPARTRVRKQDVTPRPARTKNDEQTPRPPTTSAPAPKRQDDILNTIPKNR